MTMDPQTFATCLIAVTLLTLTPGVDTMLIIRNSARGGWLDGGSAHQPGGGALGWSAVA